MANKIVVNTDILNKWAGELNAVEQLLNDARKGLLAVDTSKRSGGDLELRQYWSLKTTEMKIGGKMAAECVEQLSKALLLLAHDAEDISEKTLDASDVFSEVENDISGLATETGTQIDAGKKFVRFADSTAPLAGLFDGSSSFTNAKKTDWANAPGANGVFTFHVDAAEENAKATIRFRKNPSMWAWDIGDRKTKYRITYFDGEKWCDLYETGNGWETMHFKTKGTHEVRIEMIADDENDYRDDFLYEDMQFRVSSTKKCTVSC